MSAPPLPGPGLTSKIGDGTPAGSDPRAPAGWRTNLLLFVATLLSVFVTGALHEYPHEPESGLQGLLHELGWAVLNIGRGWTFAVPLMAILLTHELGHYFAALYHRVPASLPYFIPLPILSPFGTMGAVISMPARIRSRSSLLDIGAAGPLAGLAVALPIIVIGLSQSEIKLATGSGWQEGQCLLYLLLKGLVLEPIPPGYDVFLTPTAFAGWTGLLVTMLNLLPIGQLDGGHIAYALLGKKHDRVAHVLHLGLIGAFAYNVVMYRQVGPGMVWLVWFLLLLVVRRLSGENHPPTEPGELSPKRRIVAWACLLLFILLFMPTPMRAYSVESPPGAVPSGPAEVDAGAGGPDSGSLPPAEADSSSR